MCANYLHKTSSAYVQIDAYNYRDLLFANMVFEGLLVSVLNRFLGPYVKNLDASQLKVGIWSGT